MFPLSNSGAPAAKRTRTRILRTSSTTPNSQLGNDTPRARDVVEGQTTSVGHSSCAQTQESISQIKCGKRSGAADFSTRAGLRGCLFLLLPLRPHTSPLPFTSLLADIES